MVSNVTGQPNLRPFVPELLLTWQPTHGDDRHMQVEGSLAFIDISGFTRLTERLARKGKVGAEEMSDLLDATFSALVGAARPHGADLVKWGGDAVLLLFRGTGHAARACRAAYDMRATLRSAGRLRTTSGDVTLRMSVGIHSGRFDFYLAGDPQHHRELLVVGPEVSTTALMEKTASAGEIVLSEVTAATIPRDCHRPGPAAGMRLLRSRPGGPLPAGTDEPGSELPDTDLAQYLPPVLRAHVLAEPGEAEHRTVAVAFVRFSGTDALARTGGVGAVADALDECVRAVQSATREHGVTFFETDIDHDGGKIMLVAGAPRSHGQDEERMLRAARAVMDRAGVLALSIGVNRGPVFAGDFGPSFRRTYSIKGDAVNLAARVMSKAGPRQVLATAAALERSSTEFETSALEPFSVKGKVQPVVAAHVGAIRGTRARRRSSTVFVGRTAELATLREAFALAADGCGSHVEILGEPGIGKSRLVAEALADAAGMRTVLARCGEYELSAPYSLIRALLLGALDVAPGASSEEVARRLREATVAAAPDLVPWLPLLGIPLDLTMPATRESAELDPQFRKARLEESVVQLLTTLLDGRTVVVLEDSHLMDDASADLVSRLAQRVEERPWVLLVTRREVAGGYVPPAEVSVTAVRPGPLPPAEALVLVRAATADLPLTHEALATLTARGGGNPLFLEELVEVVGRLGSVNDLPESVHDLVTSQIDRLTPLSRTVLRYAAVLGTVADLGLLEQLLTEHLEGARLADQLLALQDFLDREEGDRVRFRHSLMKDVAYEGLPYRRRRLLHEQVGVTIERSAADPERVSEMLSLHFFAAERFDGAWTYSCIAGHRARAKYANADAIEFYQRAIESARRCPAIPAAEVAAVWQALGDAQELAGRSSAAVDAFRRARRLLDEPGVVVDLMYKEARVAQRLGKVSLSLAILTRAMRLLDEVPGGTAHGSRSRLATRYAWGRLTQRKYADALRWATAAARDAEDSGDRSVLAHAYNGLHYAHHYSGVRSEIPYGRLALLAYEELGDLAGQGHSATTLGIEAFDAGRLDDALQLFRRATEMFGRLGDAANEANATYNQADVLLRQARYQEAEPLLLDALGIARAVHDEELVALVVREVGRAYVGLGRLDEAARHLEDARRRLLALGLTDELALVDKASAGVVG